MHCAVFWVAGDASFYLPTWANGAHRAGIPLTPEMDPSCQLTKRLNKLLRQIADLKEKQASGVALTDDQMAKVAREQAVALELTEASLMS